MLKALAFIDTSLLSAGYLLKHKTKLDEGRIDLYKEGEALPILTEWKSAKGALSRLRASLSDYNGGFAPDIQSAHLEWLPAKIGTAWIADETKDIVRVRVALVTNPMAISYSGMQSAQLPIGSVYAIEHREMCSEVNFGDYGRLHLVADVKKPE